jgi:ribonuclease HI
MATRIVRKAATTKKKIIVKWIPVQVGINGNEKADDFAKKNN